MSYENQAVKQEEAGQPVEAEVRVPSAAESAAVPVLAPDLPAHGHTAAQAENPDHESPFDNDEADFSRDELPLDQETIDNAEREAAEAPVVHAGAQGELTQANGLN